MVSNEWRRFPKGRATIFERLDRDYDTILLNGGSADEKRKVEREVCKVAHPTNLSALEP